MKKNELFEQEGAQAQDRWLAIEQEIDESVIHDIRTEFDSLDLTKVNGLTGDLSRRILDLERIEAAAFGSLKAIIVQ